MAAPTTAPLHCPNCNAPVPLGDGDASPCPACQTSVPIPDKLRALRTADRETAADRKEAEHLYRKLGSPPSWWLRTWAQLAGLAGGAMAGVLAIVIAIGGVLWLFLTVGLELISHWIAPLVHVDVVDRFGGGTAYMMFAAAFALLGLFPMWLTRYLDSSGEIKHTLQASLAAKAPTQPGFPSTCRQCGAALDVPAGAYGVRCLYCQADNLVALPDAWVHAAGKRQKNFHRSIVDAAAKAKAISREAFATLKTGAIVSAIAILVFGVVGKIAVGIDRDYDVVDFSQSMKAPRTIVESSGYGSLKQGELGDAVSLGGVALRHGEVFELTSPDAGANVTVVVRNTTSFPFLRLDEELAWQRRADGTYGARFVAPYTGLFVMDVDHASGYHMRWQVK